MHESGQCHFSMSDSCKTCLDTQTTAHVELHLTQLLLFPTARLRVQGTEVSDPSPQSLDTDARLEGCIQSESNVNVISLHGSHEIARASRACQCFGWLFVATDLVHCTGLPFDALLEPKGFDVQMLHTAEEAKQQGRKNQFRYLWLWR